LWGPILFAGTSTSLSLRSTACGSAAIRTHRGQAPRAVAGHVALYFFVPSLRRHGCLPEIVVTNPRIGTVAVGGQLVLTDGGGRAKTSLRSVLIMGR
jgi:hypothetical protein